MGDGDDQQVQVHQPGFSVPAIHDQHELAVWNEAEHEASDQMLSEVELEEALGVVEVAVLCGVAVQGGGDLGEL
jgi:hypothetical protein